MKNRRAAIIALIAALSALFAPTALAISIVSFTYDGWIVIGSDQYLRFSWVTLDDEKEVQLQFKGGADNSCPSGGGGSSSGGGADIAAAAKPATPTTL